MTTPLAETDVDYAVIVRDSANRLFDSVQIESADTWSDGLWSAAESAGLTVAAVSEDAGGVGLPLGEALDMAALAARHASNAPLGETIVAAWCLDQAGFEVPDGPLYLIDVDRSGHGAGVVSWARRGRGVAVVPAETGHRIALMDGEHTVVTEGSNIAEEPRDTVTVSLDPARLRLSGPLVIPSAFALGALTRSVQIAAALEIMGGMALSYANERKQFGRPLGRFQAVQQSLASAFGEISAAAMSVKIALHGIGEAGDETRIAIAKQRTSEAAGKVAAAVHQVHGAMGFTREHDLQLYSRRVWAWRDEYGNDTFWARRLGARALAAGADRLWPDAAGI